LGIYLRSKGYTLLQYCSSGVGGGNSKLSRTKFNTTAAAPQRQENFTTTAAVW